MEKKIEVLLSAEILCSTQCITNENNDVSVCSDMQYQGY